MSLKISNVSNVCIDIRLKLACNCILFHYCKYVQKAQVKVFQNNLNSTIRVDQCSGLRHKAQKRDKQYLYGPENFLVLFWRLYHFVAQAGLKLLTSLLPQLPEFLYYKHDYDTQPRKNFSSYSFKTFLSDICFLCPITTFVPCPVSGSHMSPCIHLTHEANFTLHIVSLQICPLINRSLFGPYTPIYSAFSWTLPLSSPGHCSFYILGIKQS
jgi:hypothetical protein